MVEGDVEKTTQFSLCPFQRLTRPALHLRDLALAQQQVAVLKALHGIEERELGLACLLHLLGLAKGGLCFCQRPRLVQRIGQGRSVDHSLKGIATAVGQLDALPGVVERLLHVAEGQVEFAEVVGSYGSVLPILLCNSQLQPRLHRLGGLGQPAERAQVKAGFIQDKGLVVFPSAHPPVCATAGQKSRTARRGPRRTRRVFSH